jgi:hypothetical protein
MTTTNKNITPGEIYAIPLHLTEVLPTKSMAKEKYDPDATYAFARIIEDLAGAGVLIEIFRYLGKLNSPCDTIESSGRLIPPVTISGIEFTKKRWRKVCDTPGYNKETHSQFSEITQVLGIAPDLRLWKGGKETGRISETEAMKHEEARIWFPNQIEQRIIKEAFN